MKRVKIYQIDVFTRTPFCGNPAAVVLDALGLTTEEMQAITREMNLSETAFVLPPTLPNADYRVRIFSPRSELPFAGHPTVATASALIEEGRVFEGQIPSLIRQECGIGLVPIVVEKRSDGLFFLMTQAQPRWIDTGIDRGQCAKMLRCGKDDIVDLPIGIVSTGVNWLIIPLTNLRAIKNLKPDMDLIERTCEQAGAVGITTFCMDAEQAGNAVHVRTFAPGDGILEDPVCGSGNGSVAGYIAKHGLLPGIRFDYVAEQGSEIQRPGLVTVKAQLHEDGKWSVQVGGYAVKVLEGEILL